MFGMQIGRMGQTRFATWDQIVATMYQNGQVGGNLSFTDFSKIWQDSAGTTPYTAVEQYVGKIIDKSPNALAFTQATSAARPVVSARVNSLLNTENPSAWPTTGITGTAEAGGVSLLQSTIDNSGISPSSLYPIGSTPISNSCVYRSIEYLPGDALYVAYGPAASVSFVTIRTSDGVVVGAVGGASPLRKITQLVDGWVRVETWDSLASHSASQLSSILYFGNAFSAPYIANGGRAGTQIRVRQLQYVVLPFGSTHSVPYQRVNTPTDYDTIGFPDYAKFDGIDDNWVSAAGGGGTAGIYYCGAVRFNKVGAVQTIFSDAGTNSGYKLQLTAANQLQISAGNGTAYTAINTASTFALGDVALCEFWDDGTNIGVRLGEGTPVTVARPVVAAGTAQITIGKDNNAASNYAGINMFEPVWRYGAMPNATQREAIRAICRSKARIV